jgi:hypothetical protein
MIHYRQKTNVTCGAAAYRSLLSQWKIISEKQAVDEIQTDKTGTSVWSILSALEKRHIPCDWIPLNIDFEHYSRWLLLNSKNRLLYLACEFIDNSGRGRNRHRHHAIAVSEGFIYDPAQEKPLPIEAYCDTWNRNMIIKSMIMVDKDVVGIDK